MKKRNAWLLLCLVSFVVVNCSKKDTIPPAPLPEISYSNRIILNELQNTDDGIKLSWSKLDTSAFIRYQIIRWSGSDSLNSSYVTLAEINDHTITNYLDNNSVVAPYVRYTVIGLLQNDYYYSNSVVSNSRSVTRTDINFLSLGNISQVLFDSTTQKLIVLNRDNAKITLVSATEGTITKTVTINSTFGYGCLGKYNNKLELYLCRNDGWLGIYDAATLEKIDQVYVGTNSGYSYNNTQFADKKIFFSLNSNSGFFSYVDRDTKAVHQQSEYNYDNSQRFFIVPNSNLNVVQAGYFYGSGNLFSFNTQTGDLLKLNAWNNYNATVDQSIFQFFPNGKYFITSSNGSVFSVTLDSETDLQRGSHQFTDFAIDEKETSIYASCSNEKLIIAYSVPNYTEQKKYKTVGFPSKIFKIGNQIYSLSISNSYYNNYSFIEKIQL